MRPFIPRTLSSTKTIISDRFSCKRGFHPTTIAAMPLASARQFVEPMTINFGPQHPSAHGVLRLVLGLNGEKVVRADPHIGFLHRGSEKLMEMKATLQVMPYMDRMDYMSALANEHALLMAVEKLMEVPIPVRASYIRVIYLEITRILNHTLAIAANVNDLGALTPLLWLFEEREKLMTFYDQVSGSRLHPNYFRAGGVASDVPYAFLDQLFEWLNQFVARLDEVEDLLTGNRIIQERMKVGFVSLDQALSYGFSGPMLRASGVAWDLRVTSPYEVYPYLDVEVPYGTHGDCFDRYLIRVQEMRNSARILHQCINDIPPGDYRLYDAKFSPLPFTGCKESMEYLIAHFKYYSEGPRLPQGGVYAASESPKGELGVYLQGNGDSTAWRAHVRAPSFYHLAALPEMTQNLLIPDLVSIIGNLDIVFGEIDR